MKSSTILLILSFVFTLGVKQVLAQPEVLNGPQIQFEKESHDYGTIENGSNGDCIFTFKNTGNAPLILENVKGSCSCTVPQWPTEPILPGQTGEIKVQYNTSTAGPINKSVTITSNAVNEAVKVVRIKGNVLATKETAVESVPASRN
ncbi:DUF1573 domain-containing protein [Fluviicola chungangensis]|uniref:DUF1573 domain-containing protein n=1 Tax=Fluviicola chungangensis TaxID=2597671 RepID=A0A556MPF0_9FLAO|nr:DUF1573 domain-containing protein [Fluviicola chungangensis]TSJ41599.1 DUF1573 domain-containing protein [Fluviicola chungangensis]